MPKERNLQYKSSNKGEDPAFLIKMKEFMLKIFKQPKFERYNLKLWGDNIDGVSLFIPRFLTPLNIPCQISIDNNAYQKVARFVS